MLEGTEMVYFVGYFDGTDDYVGGTCVGLLVRGIMTASYIYAIQLNE